MPMPWSTSANVPAEEGYDRVPLDDTLAYQIVEPESEERTSALELLNEEIAHYQQQENDCQRQLDGLNSYWSIKARDLEKSIEAAIRDRTLSEEKVQAIEQPDGEVIPPGMIQSPWLAFVLNPKFSALCSAVVVMNIITMFMEMLHPKYKRDFFLLDQVVLIFYISELTLKAMLFRRELLFGPCLVVWWNWLDLIIVIVGILDQWVQPMLVLVAGDSAGNGNSQMVQIIKMLRIARLARILKTVRAFMQSDLSWTEGKHFQLFIMGTIAANSLIMSFESDFPDFWGWFYVEQILLIIFSFEILVRLRFGGCRFFYHPTDFAWNWLDFTIVSGGVVDEWLMPGISIFQALLGMKGGKKIDIGEIMTTLRMARLLRILRLVRLVKNIPPLFTLIVGIVQAMQGMAWVLVLTAVFLYAFALLSVRLIGHGLMFGGQAPPEVAAIFPNVPESMFVLFKVMNGDMHPIEPLLNEAPLSKLFFVLYMVVSSWAILSILTAVVSDNMINATDQHRNEIEGEDVENEERITREWLSELFASADKDGNGDLGEQEFHALLDDDAKLNQLMELTKLKKDDLEQVYHLLKSTDRVLRDDFIDALRTEKLSPTERSILRLEKRMINLSNTFDMEIGHIKANNRGSKMDDSKNGPSIDSRSTDMLLESAFRKIDERFDRRGRELMEYLAVQIGKGFEIKQDGSKSFTIDSKDGTTKDIEASLARIEEQLDISTQLLDRSRVECTIVSGLAKVEQQNIDIKKSLFTGGDSDSNIKSLLAKIEQQNIDIKKAIFNGSDVNSTIKSSLANLEERLESGRKHSQHEVSNELAAWMQRICQQLPHTTSGQAVHNQHQTAQAMWACNVEGAHDGVQGQPLGTVQPYRAVDLLGYNAGGPEARDSAASRYHR